MRELVLGDAGPLSPRSRRVVLATTAALGALLVFGALVFPPMHVSDERFHLDMVVSVLEGGGWPDPGARNLSDGVEIGARLLRETPLNAGEALPGRAVHDADDEPPCSGLPMPQCTRAPTLQELDETYDVDGPINSATQHPPLYYASVAGITTVLTSIVPFPGAIAFDELALLMRLVSLTFLLPLPLLVFLVAREVTSQRVARVAVLVPLTLPALLYRVGPSINNDGLLITLTSAVMLLTLRLARRGLARREQYALGVVLGLALLTKGLAITLPLGVVIGAAVAHRRLRLPLSQTVGMVTRVALTSFVAGGWWWIRNLVVLGELQPRVQRIIRSDRQPVSELPTWAGQWIESFTRSFVGDWFVLPDLRPGWAWVVVAMGGVLLLVGLWRWPDRPALAAVGVPALGTVLLVVGISASVFLASGLAKATQGRYGLSAMPIIATGVGLGLVTLLRSRDRFAPIITLAVALALQAAATLGLLERYWGERGTALAAGWDAVLAWSPFTGGAVVLALVGVVATMGWLVVLCWPGQQAAHDAVHAMVLS